MRGYDFKAVSVRFLMRTAFVAAAMAPLSAWPVIINSTFTGFTADQEAIARQAALQWQLVVGGRNQINVNFSAVDFSNSPPRAATSTVVDTNGLPTSASIDVDLSKYSWTSGAPVAGQVDGMRGMAHELGHALGMAFGAAPLYDAHVVHPSSGQSYYDVDHNQQFSAAIDFALNGNHPIDGIQPDQINSFSHAPHNSGDLMQPKAPLGLRYTPTLRHAAVLTDAFGYDVILNGFGGPAGYGTLAMSGNDDQSSSLLNMPFGINLYGSTYNNFYINNNGNISFNGPVETFTPSPFPIANQPMIAPFWGDVDTRCGSCGAVYVASPDSNTVLVTWDNVGYYDNHADKTNTFQLVLHNRSDTGNGNFDAVFRYGDSAWTTGDASGGSGGLGGTPAQAGLDAGDQTNFFTIPGSRTAGVLDLQNKTNLSSPIPGVWSLAVRNGAPPGRSADNPLMPVVTSNGWNFNFNVGPNTGRVFIDPLIAIGYDYVVNSGPNFQTVLLPNVGDSIYDLWLFDAIQGIFADSGIDILGGQIYDFGPGGLGRFSIRGIEISAGLDPTDFNAFVTGLTFAGLGTVDMDMIPVTFDANGSTVPAPSSLALMVAGLLCLRKVRRSHSI